MGSIVAGVIVKTKFVDKANDTYNRTDKFQKYIDYMDRDEATRTEKMSEFAFHGDQHSSKAEKELYDDFGKYNDYMRNPHKSSGLFTDDKDSLAPDEVKCLKRTFDTAFQNDSIMWQTVISFDNRYLAELGIYDVQSKQLNQARLRECTRNMMHSFLGEENMTASAVWSASIHYNTNHIHVHVATVEPFPTRKKIVYEGKERPKGLLRPTTFKRMKSKVVNTLLQQDRQLMDELVRQKMVGSKGKDNSFEDPILKNKFLKIYRQLPSDKRMWQYGMNGISELRPKIDDFTMTYINRYHREEFEQFRKLLLQQEKIMQRAYGLESRSHDYVDTKMNDLFKRMGNALLTEMKEYSQVEIKLSKLASIQPQLSSSTLDYSLRRVQYNLGAEFKQACINEREHEQLSYMLDM